MKPTLAKKKIIVSILILFLIVGIFVALIVYLSGLQDKTKQKHDWLKSNISDLERKIHGLSAQALQFSEAIAIWESFDEEKQKLEGIRISNAKSVIDNLEQKYKLAGLKISFSKPEDIDTGKNPDMQNDLIKVSSSSVSIDFSALTDEMVFNFMSDLRDQFPGYIKLESVSVSRTSDIEKAHLKMISEGNYPPLVSAKLKFLWMDMKYIAPIVQPAPGIGG